MEERKKGSSLRNERKRLHI